MIHFFSKKDEGRIVEAIRKAENRTSGEIRVHLESKVHKTIFEDAKRIFSKLKMDRTELRNGVLILIAPRQHKLAIVGDQGINNIVEEDFWDEEIRLMTSHFERGQYADGLVKAIERVGEKLKEHFPVTEDDENELPNEISYGKR